MENLQKEFLAAQQLAEFKQRMHIFHDSEDENLRYILEESIDYFSSKGLIDNKNQRLRRLIFERGRYAYNDSIEFFEDNFVGEITGLMIERLPVDE